MLVYVDDILLASNSTAKLKEVERELVKEYELTSMGEPKYFLGMEIMRDQKRGIVRLSQRKFAESILSKYKYESMKENVTTPMAANEQRKKLREKEAPMSTREVKKFPYRQIIGSLLYLQGGTRPNLTYAVNVLSRKQLNFDAYDCTEVKRVLRYLNSTLNVVFILHAGRCFKICIKLLIFAQLSKKHYFTLTVHKIVVKFLIFSVLNIVVIR